MADSDVQSPTQAIQAYLRSKGMQPTAENVRRVLAQNSREPGTIPGLRNEAPPDENKQDGQPARNQSAASRIEKDNNLPLPPPAPPGQTNGSVGTSSPQSDPNTPSMSLSSIIDPIAAILGIGGAALGGKMLLGNRPNVQQDVADLQSGKDTPLLPGKDTPLLNWERMGDPELAGPQVAGAITDQSTPSTIRMPDETSGPTIPMPDGASPIAMNSNGMQGMPTVQIQPQGGSVSGDNPITMGAQLPNRPVDVNPAQGMQAWDEEAHGIMPVVNDILRIMSHARR